MRMRSVLIASLGAARFGPVEEITVVDGDITALAGPIKVPAGSQLCSIQVGRESVFLVVQETDDPEQELITVHILADDHWVKRGRCIGSFVYPFDGEHRRPTNPSQERSCIAHVVEIAGPDNRPVRKLLPRD